MFLHVCYCWTRLSRPQNEQGKLLMGIYCPYSAINSTIVRYPYLLQSPKSSNPKISKTPIEFPL